MPLPAGFQLDAPLAGNSPQLPEGFKLDSPIATNPKANLPKGFVLDSEGGAQNLGMTGREEPNMEPVGLLGVLGEGVRRVMNIPTGLVQNQEMFPAGQPILPATGTKWLMDKLINLPGERQFGRDPVQAEKELYEKFGTPMSPSTSGMPEPAQGFKQGLANLGEKFVTPENIGIAATAAAAPMAGLAKAAVEAGTLSYFLPDLLVNQLPHTLKKTWEVFTGDKPTTLQEKVTQGTETMGEVIAADLMRRQAFRPEVDTKTGITPTENPSGAAALLQQFYHREPPVNIIPPGPNPIPLPSRLLSPEFEDIKFRPPQQPFQGSPPIVGQRPLTVEQQVLPPVEARPSQGVVSPELPGALKEKPLAGQISFEGEGVPSSMQAEKMIPENIIKSLGEQQSGKKFYSGLGNDWNDYQDLAKQMLEKIRVQDYTGAFALQSQTEAIKNRQPIKGTVPFEPGKGKETLRPAINVGGKILVGEVGETHADVLQRNGIDPETIKHEDPRRGFISTTYPDRFLDRRQAERIAEVVGTAKAGGLDSMDLIGKGQPNAIRELRTDRVSETQPPGDIQKVDEEVRQGTGEEGEARGGQKGGEEQGVNPLNEVKEKIKGSTVKTPVYHIARNVYERADPAKAMETSPHGSTFGMHFGTEEQAKGRFEQFQASPLTVKANLPINTSKYYIDLKSPYRVTDTEANDPSALAPRLYHDGMLTKEEYSRVIHDPNMSVQEKAKVLIKALKYYGYDGLSYINDSEGKGRGESHVVFDKDQIVNATAPRRTGEGKLYSGLSPEDIKKAIKAGANFAMGKVSEDPSAPKFIYRITKDGQAEEITDQYELAHAIGQLDESHYWVKPDGKMVKGEGQALTHYLAAKKILGEKITDTEGSDLRDVYKKMRSKGWARVLEQDDKVFIKGQANDAQINAARKLAEKDGKQVWHNSKEIYTPEADEQAGGTLEDDIPDDREMYPDDQDYGTDYHSGLPVIGTVQDLVKHVLGTEVNRKRKETLEYYAGKAAGVTLPRHVAANEAVANKLVRVAAADITTAVAKASSVAAKAYKDNAVKDLYNEYIKSGLGQKYTRGALAPPPTMKYAEVGRKPIWLRKDLIPELKQAFNPATQLEDSSVGHYLMNLATDVQLVGITDLTFHTANMLASMSMSLGKGGDIQDVLLNLPVVGTLDALARVGEQTYRMIIKDPNVQNELVKIASIGALRGVQETKAYTPSGIIQAVDKAGRLARNKMYDNLVQRKLIKESELGRREFINKMGQYNERLMTGEQAYWRARTSPFVVAGRTFNRNALQNFMMSTPAEALNPAAYAKMKALNLISFTASAFAIPMVVNSMITGNVWGRPGTDPGMIDTGKNGPDGRPIQLDPMQLNLLRRGYRNLGAQALVRGLDKGDKPIKIVGDMAKDVVAGILHPWLGPPIRAGYTFLSGETPEGFTVAKDPKDPVSRLKAALTQANPMFAAWAEGKQTEQGSVKYSAERLGSAFGYKKGKFPTHDETLEREQGKPIEQMDIGERLLAEKEHHDNAKPLTPEAEVLAAQKSIKSNVERGTTLQESLDKGDKQWLESRGLRIPGFDNKLIMAKQKVYLTEGEMEKYTSLLKDNVETAIVALRDVYDDLDDEEKPKAYSEIMSLAKKQAREQMEVELVQGVPKKKKKRFSIFSQD